MASIIDKFLDYIGLEEEPAEESVLEQDEKFYEEEPVYKNEPRPKRGKVVNIHQSTAQNANAKLIIYQPLTYEDTQNMIDNLRNRKPVIANLESLDHDMAQRVIDIMSGAMYALGGNIHKVSSGIYVFAPESVDVAGNISGDLNSGFFEMS
ncbi:MAG: cell division protein SepF [Christensenellales bacterium]|jgi:cell division inhibitor SepF